MQELKTNNRLLFQWILHCKQSTSLNMENVSSSSKDFIPSLRADHDFKCAFKVVQSEITFLDICTAVVSIVSAIPAVLGSILILLAICKTSSIAPPSEVLLGSLALTRPPNVLLACSLIFYLGISPSRPFSPRCLSTSISSWRFI